MRHRLTAAAFALLLTAQAPPAPAPAPASGPAVVTPAALAPYVKDGRFDPGDYGWMRGSFADATPTQKAGWKALWAWREACRGAQFAAIRAELAKRGITPITIDRSNGTGLSGAMAYALPQGDQGERWPAFQAARARAQPIARAIVWSAALAQSAADPTPTPDQPDLAAALLTRPITDQMLRRALSWDQGGIPGAPPLDPAARGVAAGLIWLAIAERDHANTAWLKATVADRGWPTVAKVGATASHLAWLLVQHADDDPIFQLDMLRLMEPFAARAEVARRDYAYLYDRVMLKLAGKQRYGSQMECVGGRYAPQPLEDAANVDRLRATMGLGTMADDAAQIAKEYGPCPVEPMVPPAVPTPPLRR